MKGMKKKKLLFIGPLKSTFAKNDITSLSEKYDLFCQDAAIGRGLSGVVNLVILTIKSIFYIFLSDAVFCWFADYTTLIPSIVGRLLGKKVLVVAGGFDVLCLPEIGCGAKTRPLRWFCVSNTFKTAHRIFPVSHFADANLELLTEGKHAKTMVIHNCIDTLKFISYSDEHSAEKRDIILTVSRADDSTDYYCKGTDRFIKVASMMPDFQFVVAGLSGQALELAKKDSNGLDNIQLIKGPLSLYEQIMPLYARTIAYCQFSMAETFGVAVLESMACGAVPVVYNSGALPEITGGHGYVVNSETEAVDALNTAVSVSHIQREEMRQHTLAYDIAVRKRKLLKYL